MEYFTTRAEQDFMECIASYTSYRDAEQAVDYLADQKYPVEYVTIVAGGLRYIEKVTGRLTWFKAVLNSATAGLVVGALIGFIFGLFNVMRPLVSGLVLAFNGGLIGLIIGATFGLASYLLMRGRRDFMAAPAIDAAYYDLMVRKDYAAQAKKLLQEKFGSQAIQVRSAS